MVKIILSGSEWPMTLKVGMQHWVLEYNQDCSNDYPELTLNYFTARSNLAPHAFVCNENRQKIAPYGDIFYYLTYHMKLLCFFVLFNVMKTDKRLHHMGTFFII